MSVRSKTQLVTTLSLLAVLVLALSSVYFAGQTKAAAHRLMDVGVVGSRLANQLDLKLQRHRNLIASALPMGDEYRLAGIRDTKLALEHETLADITGRHSSPAVADGPWGRLENQLQRELPPLFDAGDLVLILTQDQQPDQAREVLQGAYAAMSEHVLEEISVWRGQQGWVLDQQVNELFANSDSLMLWVYAATCGTLCAGVFGFSMMERLLARMRDIQNAMLRLASQDVTVEIPSLGDVDEIGEVARAVEVFKRNAVKIEQQQAELTRSSLRFQTALSNMSQGLCLYDSSGRLDVFNQRFCEIYRLDPLRVRAGMSLAELIRLIAQAGNHPDDSYEQVLSERQALVDRREACVSLQDLEGGRVVAVSHCPMQDGGWVATCEDVTARQSAEARVRYLARHDSLTGLSNRVVFNERLDTALLDSARGLAAAVLCLDLDRFKAVNDTLGHHIGDELLRAVADRLLACVREGDVVARLGGDEFAILQNGVGRPEDAKLLAERILDTMETPFFINDNQIVIGTSIGLALVPEDGMTSTALLKNADTALYRAKFDGRGTFCFFEADMDARLQQRRQLELDMRKGLLNHEFELFYQPLINLERHEVSGFEALLRWRHPARGLVSPAEFIPIAEEIGLIIPLGEWVLREACAEAATWPEGVKVAVNLSPVQFKNKNLVASVAQSLRDSGLPAHQLELEITETVLLQESASTLAILHELRALGARISMDDFGTGYSSLSYLRSFPFDKIKIDQSFIRDLSSRADSIHIVRAVRGLCAGLGMLTTAEGVETEDQLEKLRAEGCTEVQGYLFGAPKPPSFIPGMMRVVRDAPTGQLLRQLTAQLSAAD